MKNENDENHAQLLLTPKAYSRHFAIHSRSKRGSDLGKGKVSAKPKCNPKRPTSTFANGTFASPYAVSVCVWSCKFDSFCCLSFLLSLASSWTRAADGLVRFVCVYKQPVSVYVSTSEWWKKLPPTRCKSASYAYTRWERACVVVKCVCWIARFTLILWCGISWQPVWDCVMHTWRKINNTV